MLRQIGTIIIIWRIQVINVTEAKITYSTQNTGMCPGLGEWWLHKEVSNLRNLVIFYFYAQIVSRIPCRHFILCTVASKTKHFHSC